MAIASAKIGVSMVGVADCHTTLYYLANPPAAAALPFASESDYNALHENLGTAARKLEDLRSGYSAKMLKDITPAYKNNKYWRKATGLDDLATYWMSAWSNLLPLQCSLLEKIEIESGGLNVKVRPKPSVLLYPFGWSTQVNIRLTGEHSLETLSKFVVYLAKDKCIRVLAKDGTKSNLLSLPEYFSRVAIGVRADAFGNNQTGDKSAKDLIYVTTVLQKTGFSPTSNPDEDEKTVMLRIISPEGALPSGSLSDYLYQRNSQEPRDFVLFRKNGRFIWTEDLLDTADQQNRIRLECRHHNSLRTMAHAQHLCDLIKRVLPNPVNSKSGLSNPLLALISEAANQLSSPGYENASLIAFLKAEEAQSAIKKVNDLNSK
jgi:hypothetical protein